MSRPDADERPIRRLVEFVQEVCRCTHEPSDEAVDVFFIRVQVVQLASDRDRFLQLLRAALADHGEFCDLTPERLSQGPSYIELGGWLGDQTVALMFIALGARLDLWDVITPATFGVQGEAAKELAGNGMVLVGPKPELRGQLDANLIPDPKES